MLRVQQCTTFANDALACAEEFSRATTPPNNSSTDDPPVQLKDPFSVEQLLYVHYTLFKFSFIPKSCRNR